MKNKGFTLIELLAVIVILAIIALITLPLITGVVEKARKGSAVSSAYGYVDAVEKYVVQHDLDSTKFPYDLKGKTLSVSSQNEGEISLLNIIPKVKAESTVIPPLNDFIKVKGAKPTGGVITINEKGLVVEASLEFNNNFVGCNNTTCKIVVPYTIKYEANGGTGTMSDSLNNIAENTFVAPEGTKFKEWNTKADGSGETYTTSSVVSSDLKLYAIWIESPISFATDKWETIIKAVRENNTSVYNVGDEKEIDMGTFGKQKLRISNKTSCTTEESETACGFVIEFKTTITTHTMNSTNTSVGGWPASSMRTYVNNEIYNALPTDLKAGIIDTKVVSGHGKISGEENFISTDKIYLLSRQEVMGDNFYRDTAASTTRQLDIYTSNTAENRIKLLNDGTTQKLWWLRTAAYDPNDTDYNTYWFYVYAAGGGSHFAYANNAYGVSPAFRIG